MRGTRKGKVDRETENMQSHRLNVSPKIFYAISIPPHHIVPPVKTCAGDVSVRPSTRTWNTLP